MGESFRKLFRPRMNRFAIVGVANTALNFAVLNFVFYSLQGGKFISSFIATSCAVIFSFILNRNLVFMDKVRPAKKLVLFIIVTVSGVLLIQNSVYALGIKLLQHHELRVSNFIYAFTDTRFSSDFIDVNLSNLIASLFVMAWNYNGYRLLVFKGERHDNVGTKEA